MNERINNNFFVLFFFLGLFLNMTRIPSFTLHQEQIMKNLDQVLGVSINNNSLLL